jgi:hypothetical protein
MFNNFQCTWGGLNLYSSFSKATTRACHCLQLYVPMYAGTQSSRHVRMYLKTYPGVDVMNTVFDDLSSFRWKNIKFGLGNDATICLYLMSRLHPSYATRRRLMFVEGQRRAGLIIWRRQTNLNKSFVSLTQCCSTPLVCVLRGIEWMSCWRIEWMSCWLGQADPEASFLIGFSSLRKSLCPR